MLLSGPAVCGLDAICCNAVRIVLGFFVTKLLEESFQPQLQTASLTVSPLYNNARTERARFGLCAALLI